MEILVAFANNFLGFINVEHVNPFSLSMDAICWDQARTRQARRMLYCADPFETFKSCHAIGTKFIVDRMPPRYDETWIGFGPLNTYFSNGNYLYSWRNAISTLHS
jgi:hypothetical protein